MTAGGARLEERDEFANLVGPCLPALRRFAVSVSSIHDADDLVQDTVARAWAKRTQYEPSRGSVAAWLMAILFDRARRNRRVPRPSVQLVESDDAVAGPDGTSVDLRRAINELPPRQRTAFVLHHYVDLPIDDVARLMGCAAGTVKSTLHDARRALATKLGESYARPR